MIRNLQQNMYLLLQDDLFVGNNQFTPLFLAIFTTEARCMQIIKVVKEILWLIRLLSESSVEQDTV